MITGRKKRVAVLGATGSVGTSAMRVLRAMGDQWDVVLLSAGGGRIDALAALTAEFAVPHAVTADAAQLPHLRALLPSTATAYGGNDALCALLRELDIDLVICAIVGLAALEPAIAALGSGKRLALASKEVLVTAGSLVMDLAREKNITILPVDSEHSALFQCLDRHDPAEVEKLLLTASGGPFRKTPAADLAKVTFDQAMAHPTWNMGPKVTLDSATLMNKALEMIEAHHLFGVSAKKIEVVVHPQSIIHSMVEWCDGAVSALLSVPDMRFPVQYALTYPERMDAGLPKLDWTAMKDLTFEAPDESRFPSLTFARHAMREDGTMAAVMLAANETACDRFCRGEVTLPDIWRIIERTMSVHQNKKTVDLAEIREADRWARSYASTI